MSTPPSKIEISVQLDSDLIDQVSRLTNDPSKVIEVALRQWLRSGRRQDTDMVPLAMNPPVPPKGEWND
jgi:Post-segregation antitoxin CcdA